MPEYTDLRLHNIILSRYPISIANRLDQKQVQQHVRPALLLAYENVIPKKKVFLRKVKKNM